MWDRVTELLQRENAAIWAERTDAAYAKQTAGQALDDMDREAINRHVSEGWF